MLWSFLRVDTRSLKTHRNYRLFFWGQFVSLIGSWMQGVAQGWLVYRITGSELQLGAVAFATNLPVLLLGPVAGWAADRYPRRTIVLLTHVLSMVQAGALAVLTLSGVIREGHGLEWVFVLAVVYGIANAFEIPARHSFVGDLVGRVDLSNAIALNGSMINVTRILGPATAAWVLPSLGEGLCFTINAATFVVALVTLLLIRVPAPVVPASRLGPIQQVVEGVRWVRTKRPIAGLLLLLTASSFMQIPYMVLLPAFAKGFWGVDWGSVALGLFQAMAGVGALVGAFMLTARKSIDGLYRQVVLSVLIAGIVMVHFAFSPWFALALLLIVPLNWALIRNLAGTNTLLQSMVPDDMRGRVMSFYSMMLVGMAPFGALLAGALAERIGAHVTVALFGGFGAVAAAIALLLLPRLHDETRELLRSTGALP